MTTDLSIALPTTGKARKSPTQRTLAYLKMQGYTCGIVERWNPKIRNKKHDLFGIIDIIALSATGVIGVQSTGTDFAGHRRKLTESHAVQSALWLLTPGTELMLIGWRKVKRNTGREHYEPRIEMLRLEHLVGGLEALKRYDLLNLFR